MFLPPAGRDSARRPGESSAAASLPPDLRVQATQRLRAVALIYAATYFLAGVFPALVIPHYREEFMRPTGWIPSTASILFALAIAFVVSRPTLSWDARVNIGLVFQVLGSYGIAAATFMQVPSFPLTPDMLRLMTPAWVGIWMLFYTVVVPAPPWRALLAAIGSATAVPVVLGFTLTRAHLWHLSTPFDFFMHQIFPYLICVFLAYVGARVVFRLGAAVSKAREVGSYRLIERLAHGGMGEVWKASHQMLARPAAVKFIRPDALSGLDASAARQAIRRFELEARATASLTSPHTVALYDFGVTDDGVFYSVMELLDGLDFDELVRRFGPLPPARSVHLLLQACESLDEAHKRGLIHRDVKPANLYACRSGTRCDFVKVLDFGLVAHDPASGAGESRLTLPEEATGTPAYMPPEVALGRPIDGRADLYALGCVGYWLVTGRIVFEGNTVYDVIAHHLNSVPVPPSKRAGVALPGGLDETLLRCLEKDPARRPADARTLATMLRAVPVDAPWDDERAEAWWAAHMPTPAAGVTAAAVKA